MAFPESSHNQSQPGIRIPARRPLRRRGSPWSLIGAGLLAALLALLFSGLVPGLGMDTGVPRPHWLIAWLQEIGGSAAVPVFFGALALLFLASGSFGLAQAVRERRSSPPLTLAELNAALVEELGFSPEDLAANRQGLLSERQQRRLSTTPGYSGTASWAIWSLFALMMAGIAGYILFLAPVGTAQGRGLSGDPAMAVVVVLVFGAVIVIMFIAMIRALLRSSSAGRPELRVVEGRVRLRAQHAGALMALVGAATGHGSYACTIKVGRTLLRVSESQLDAFQHKSIYRVYYVRYPSYNMILAAEAVRER